jgi:flagellar biogenesis protein FliO
MRLRFALGAGSLALAVSALTPVCAFGAAPATQDAAVQRSWLRDSGAITAAKGKATKGQPSRSYGTVLAVLLLAALVSGALYQRWQRRRTVRAARLSQIQVVSASRVGPKAQLVIASVGKRLLLLGVTDSQVTKLEWLDEPLEAAPEADAEEAPAALTRSAGPPDAPRGHFLGVLLDAMGNKSARAGDESASAAVALAQQTRDFVSRSTGEGEKARATGRSASRPARTPPDTLPERAARSDRISLAQSPEPDSIHVEGQAAGLVARLARSRP